MNKFTCKCIRKSMCQCGSISVKIFYKAERELARQRLQNKKRKKERKKAKSQKKKGNRFGDVRMESVKGENVTCKKQAHLKQIIKKSWKSPEATANK